MYRNGRSRSVQGDESDGYLGAGYLRYLPIDRDRIKGEIPKLGIVELVPAFGDLLKQKIYTNNTSVATIAYLGRLLGKTCVAESAQRSAEIEPILTECTRRSTRRW